MRELQFRRLEEMNRLLRKVIFNQSEAELLSRFTDELANDFHEQNDGNYMLLELGKIKEAYFRLPLPASTIEFQNRAFLYQYMNDLENFVEIKQQFMTLLSAH